jgi:hypothetical protein
MRRAEFGDDREIRVLTQGPRHPGKDVELGSLNVNFYDINLCTYRQNIVEANDIDLNPQRSSIRTC